MLRLTVIVLVPSVATIYEAVAAGEDTARGLVRDGEGAIVGVHLDAEVLVLDATDRRSLIPLLLRLSAPLPPRPLASYLLILARCSQGVSEVAQRRHLSSHKLDLEPLVLQDTHTVVLHRLVGQQCLGSGERFVQRTRRGPRALGHDEIDVGGVPLDGDLGAAERELVRDLTRRGLELGHEESEAVPVYLHAVELLALAAQHAVGHGTPGRVQQQVTPSRRKLDLDAHPVRAGRTGRVEHDDRGCRDTDLLHDRLESTARHLLADLLAPVEAGDHLPMHLIHRAATDGVVGVVLQKVSPGLVHEGRQFWGFGLQAGGDGREGFSPSLQQRLAGVVVLLDPHPGREDTGQQVGALRGAELALDGGQWGFALAQFIAHGGQVAPQGRMDDTGIRQSGVGRRQQPGKVGPRSHMVGALHGQDVRGGNVRDQAVA